jgi:hypothetical protein
LKLYLHTTVLAIICAIALLSCKKQDFESPALLAESELVFDLTMGQAIADDATEAANDIFFEAVATKNLLYNNTTRIATNNNLKGAAITVTPASGFPKTILIDFGTNTTSIHGVTRSGSLNIVLTDYADNTNSKATITFNNFKVDGIKKEGNITITNTSTNIARSWTRKVENGRVTTSDGKYWLYNGVRHAVQIAGAPTPYTLIDDSFLITGHNTVTNANGALKQSTITQALQKSVVCNYITTGKLKIISTNTPAVIDFGTGDCDRTATISIQGKGTRTINLR